jgi:PKD repeat protein
MAINGIGNYFHNYGSLSGGGVTPPTANFAASPTNGAAPLAVSFTDTSDGVREAWAWDFESDGIVDSNVQNPSFTYATPGTYTVNLTVSNTAGSSALTRTGYITVTPSQGGSSTATFLPTDDAFVRSPYPNENSGGQPTLRTYTKLPIETHSYLTFPVTGVSGRVFSAKLRLFVTDASAVSGKIYGVADTTWSEGAITWTSKPAVGSLLASGGSAPLGTWVEFDLGTAIAGNGVYSLVLKDGGTDAAWYSSREGSNPPQLVVTFGS